eukprot:g22824.t1
MSSSAYETTSAGVSRAEQSPCDESETEFFVPGLESSESDSVYTTPYNSFTAHQNGSCKPCRFFHAKEEGCRIGNACN